MNEFAYTVGQGVGLCIALAFLGAWTVVLRRILPALPLPGAILGASVTIVLFVLVAPSVHMCIVSQLGTLIALWVFTLRV